MIGLDELHRQGPARHGRPIALPVLSEFTFIHSRQRDRFGPWL